MTPSSFRQTARGSEHRLKTAPLRELDSDELDAAHDGGYLDDELYRVECDRRYGKGRTAEGVRHDATEY